ncbi:MAG TPA: ShlB/FhaC/HecB family hemolysin secretion/activation protein, partial [Polyangiales bacterium]
MARAQCPLPRGVHRLLQASALPAALALLAAPPLQAQPVPGPSQIERQQQERLRELQERALPQPAPREGTDLQRIAPQVVVPEVAGCVDIRELRIEGATRLAPAIRAEARLAATGCLGSLQIEALLAALTKDYIDRGYVTTRIYVEPQDLRQGVLRLRVVEGRIERYETVKEDARDDAQDRLWLAGAFPARPGELLNLRDLEQGIDQLNTLQSNGATLELRPGTLAGESVVVVRNRAGNPVNLFLSYDNLGSPATGEDNLGATLSFNGVLGLNELVAFTRNQTTPRGSEHQSDSSAVRIAIPYGYWTLALDASHSDYTN